MNRRLTESGIEAFRSYLESLGDDPMQPPPLHLLHDPATSAQVDVDVPDVTHKFECRHDCGVHVRNALQGDAKRVLMDDSGFWSALALLWFAQLCARTAGGRWKPARWDNYILSDDFRQSARHAIRTAWQLASQHGESARFMQSKPMPVRGEIVEQFMQRQYYLGCKGALGAASLLYTDPNTGSFKRGATGRDKPGCINRYITWLLQIRQTYDLHSISAADLYSMLPSEFDRFKPTTARSGSSGLVSTSNDG